MNEALVGHSNPETTLKLPERVRFLAIDGVIGAGKTSLARILAEALGANLVLEQFDENPFLSSFYRNPEAYAFQTQLFFLLSRIRQFQDAFVQNDLFRHVVVSDYTFEKDRIFALQNRYDHHFWHYTKAPVLIINTNKIDFVHNERHLELVLNAIASAPTQTTYFAPEGG